MRTSFRQYFISTLVILATALSGSNCRGGGECCCVATYTTGSTPQIIGNVEWCGGSGPVEVCEGSWTCFWVNVQDTDHVSVDCDEECCEDCDWSGNIGGSPSANWTASAGTPGSANNTTAFYWTAPTLDPGECERTVTITATARDGAFVCPSPGYCQNGNCKDGNGGSKSLQVKVIKCSCDDLEAEVTAGSFNPDPVCAGDETTLNPSISMPEEACTCDEGADIQYSWSFVIQKKNAQGTWDTVPNTGFLTVTGGNTSSPTVTCEFPSCGYWRVKAQGTVSWLNENCSTRCSAPGEDIAEVTVVALDRVIVQGSSPEDTGPAGICLGDSITLEAKPCPEGASFPTPPVWTLTSKPAGSALPTNLGSGTTKSITPDVHGNYTVKAEACNSSDTITVGTVKLTGITVESGATQTNVTGAKNWAAVKKANEYVIVRATTDPDVAWAWEKISWTGGQAVPGGTKNKRRVPKDTSAKTNVEASMCSTSKDLDVWILWGTVTIKMTGTTPPNAVQFGTAYDGTEDLGAKSYSGGTKAVGKVVPIAQLTPAGVKDVVKAGWGFKRERMWRICIDGAQTSTWESAWTNDTSLPAFQMLTPDVDDKIYDRDAPSIGNSTITDCQEVWLNLRQWIEWNNEVASDQYTDWSWHAKKRVGATPEEVTLKAVSGSHLSLPSACPSCP